MFQQPLIAPSLLSADFMQVASQVDMLETAGADWLHVDVMDGHFVPNLTMGVPYTAQLRKITNLPIDAHLMVSNPLTQIPWFLEAGANIISFHLEALMGESVYGNRGCVLDAKGRKEALPSAIEKAHKCIELIRNAGAKAAIAIKPKTEVCLLDDIISELDMVLVMSVEPGFSGQGFIEGSDARVAEVCALAQSYNVAPLIEIDGGINAETAALVASAGADVFVSGNYVLKAADPSAACNSIRNSALDAVR